MRPPQRLWNLLTLAIAASACNRSAAPPSPPPSLPTSPSSVAAPLPTSAQPLPASRRPTEPVPTIANPDASWQVCARHGAELRKGCRAQDEACSQDADGKIADCYRHVYTQRVDKVGDRLELLGPRFAFESRNAIPEKDGSVSYRQEGDAKYLSPRKFAAEICAKALADVPRSPCIEELIFGVDRLVWMGGFGAGP